MKKKRLKNDYYRGESKYFYCWQGYYWQEVLHKKLKLLRPPYQQPVVAVYKFTDLTGQRKSKQNIADFSTAVTQGAESLLIDALKAAGDGRWFRVVERTGLDHLVRERQIVKSTRQTYLDMNDDKEVIQPMLVMMSSLDLFLLY